MKIAAVAVETVAVTAAAEIVAAAAVVTAAVEIVAAAVVVTAAAAKDIKPLKALTLVAESL